MLQSESTPRTSAKCTGAILQLHTVSMPKSQSGLVHVEFLDVPLLATDLSMEFTECAAMFVFSSLLGLRGSRSRG
jgi:hypothetical protein